MVGNGNGGMGWWEMVGWWVVYLSLFFGPTSIDVSLNRGGGKELLNISPSNMRLFKVKGGFLSTLPYFLWFFVRSFPPQKHSRKPRFSFPSPDA